MSSLFRFELSFWLTLISVLYFTAEIFPSAAASDVLNVTCAVIQEGNAFYQSN